MFLDFIGVRGQELFNWCYFSWNAKPTERVAIDTTPQPPPPVLCQMPFLMQPFQFIPAWDWRRVLQVWHPVTLDPHCLKLRDKPFFCIELRQWLGIDDIVKVI